MYLVNPSEGERYYLRLLLLHVKGAKSYEDLKFHEIQHATFKEAALSRGLLKDDVHFQLSMSEASFEKMPYQLRQMFATILIFNNPSNPRDLYEMFKFDLCEDFLPKNSNNLPFTIDQIKSGLNKSLNEIEQFLNIHRKNGKMFNLPDFIPIVNTSPAVSIHEYIDLGNLLKSKCNEQQLFIVNTILNAINDKVKKAKAFFIDAPGGCGKTFVYNTITNIIKGQNKKVLSVAWTGIAAILLIDGRTVHSAFRLPLTLNEDSRCNMNVDSALANELKEVSLICVDEVHKNSSN
jgi:ATP-dependent DNA helicase PIF1